MLSNGGGGVGLYRTEFLYLTSGHAPDEGGAPTRHTEQAIKMLEGRPLVIRTQDLGADKYTQEQAEEPERNPFLGCRSIRYSLLHLKEFKTQLRAILRAATDGPVKVMFPAGLHRDGDPPGEDAPRRRRRGTRRRRGFERGTDVSDRHDGRSALRRP